MVKLNCESGYSQSFLIYSITTPLLVSLLTRQTSIEAASLGLVPRLSLHSLNGSPQTNYNCWRDHFLVKHYRPLAGRRSSVEQSRYLAHPGAMTGVTTKSVIARQVNWWS